jgi:uncharacterized protein (TIGR00255 family)
MIKSMTGFGRCEASDEYRKVAVEIKAVNHRYLDLNLKIPRYFSAMEAQIRNEIKKYVFRGKVDVSISYEDYSEGQTKLHYNAQLAGRYLEYLKQMEEEFGIRNDVSAGSLSRYPDVFTMENVQDDDEEMQNLLMQALSGALKSFTEAREKEGMALATDLNAKLQQMLLYVDEIEKRYPEVVNEYRSKLTDKVKELLGDAKIDENRLATEIVIYADKICVDEETVRLRAHIQSTLDTMNAGGSVGRKLDFVAQEMNREANTILSKSTDREIADTAIELKTDVERVREQIQNIE